MLMGSITDSETMNQLEDAILNIEMVDDVNEISRMLRM